MEFPDEIKDGHFLFHHWLWQHIWQRKEHKKIVELFEIARKRGEAEKCVVTANDLKRLQRCWYFISDVNIGEHSNMEDTCFFPVLKECLLQIRKQKNDQKVGEEEKGEEEEEKDEEVNKTELDEIEATHPILVKTMADISKQFAELAEAESVSEEDYTTLFTSVKSFVKLYGEHSHEEEDTLVPLVKQHMPLGQQKIVGDKIRDYVKGMDCASFALLMFRDTVAEIPREKQRFDNFFPFILRWGVLPVLAYTDALYSEYQALFVKTWPSK
eukprot:TRINITY_DN12101_c0_g1_i1.p1 TRINITY_DN12101_c0_g1~~TRINITY_DN12101_c0_g1_i1.p1  ORF type:complete len:270 (-),score=48.78 TRINITY_DN12101_c0_g1_i1:81-890(-)